MVKKCFLPALVLKAIGVIGDSGSQQTYTGMVSYRFLGDWLCNVKEDDASDVS